MMLEQRTEHQHFIPQFLLSNFVNDAGKLWCYRRKDNKYYPTVPRSICYQNNLYEVEWVDGPPGAGKYILDNSTEQDFAQKEKEYAILINRLIGRCKQLCGENQLICLNAEERNLLADFCTNMFMRNPFVMEVGNVGEVPEDAIDNQLIRAVKQIFTDMNLGDWRPILRKARQKVWFSSNMDDAPANLFKQNLLKIPFHFYYDGKGRFLFGEVPFSFYGEPMGEITLFYLPLSKNCAVLYSYLFSRTLRNRAIPAPDKKVQSINSTLFQYDLQIQPAVYGANKKDIEKAERLSCQSEHNT